MRVAVVGLGPIGIEVARAVGARAGLTLVAAVDALPALAGRQLAEIVAGSPAGITVDGTLAAALARGVDAVALCTGSWIAQVGGDLAQAIAAGAHVVSTCEELAWPFAAPEAASLDEAARKAGVTLLGTGVNPGFVMDRLPLQLAAMCVRVDGVRIERIVDASRRRLPLQKKVGYGLTVEEFHAGVAAQRLGHVGLGASAQLLARGLGTSLRLVDQEIEPVLDAAGLVLGLRQCIVAATADGREIALLLQMSVGAPEPHDRVMIAGDPPLDVTIAGGVQGDRATVAAVVEGLARLPRAPRGLCTVADLY